jgi:hypothetical protein
VHYLSPAVTALLPAHRDELCWILNCARNDHIHPKEAVSDEIFETFDAKRDICGRANTAAIVRTVSDENCHGIDFDVDEILNAITMLVNSSITLASDLHPRAQLGMNWLPEMNRVAMTSHIAKGSRVSIRGCSATKTMAHNLWSNQRTTC